MIRKLFIKNLPRDMNMSEDEELFSKYGKVVSAYIFKNSVTSKSKCYGFVEMENAHADISKLNGMNVRGKRLRVRPARSGVKRRREDRTVRTRA